MSETCMRPLRVLDRQRLAELVMCRPKDNAERKFPGGHVASVVTVSV